MQYFNDGGVWKPVFSNYEKSARASKIAYTQTINNNIVVIPNDCTSINVKVWGAGGGGGNANGAANTGGDGGSGGYAASTISVTPGEQLRVVVGEGGTSGKSQTVVGSGNTVACGGGGGGYTGVFRNNTPLIIAGAGGGGGASGKVYNGKGGFGGPGGSTVGSTGSIGSGTDRGAGGVGGTQSAGGNGGNSGESTGSAGTAGDFLEGGNGGSAVYPFAAGGWPGGGMQGTLYSKNEPGGGGGGAGYYGGGGGENGQGTGAGGGGGGGGSSYVTGTSQVSLRGTLTVPPNNTDPDYISGVGVGGTAGTTTTLPTKGGDGLVVIEFSTGASATWNRVKQAYTNDGGTWKLFHSAANITKAFVGNAPNGLSPVSSGNVLLSQANAKSYTFNNVNIGTSSIKRTIFVISYNSNGSNSNTYMNNCTIKLGNVLFTANTDQLAFINASGCNAATIFSLNTTDTTTSTCSITVSGAPNDAQGCLLFVIVVEGLDYSSNVATKNPYYTNGFSQALNVSADQTTFSGTVPSYPGGIIIAAASSGSPNTILTWNGVDPIIDYQYNDSNQNRKAALAVFLPTTKEAARNISLLISQSSAIGRFALATAAYR